MSCIANPVVNHPTKMAWCSRCVVDNADRVRSTDIMLVAPPATARGLVAPPAADASDSEREIMPTAEDRGERAARRSSARGSSKPMQGNELAGALLAGSQPSTGKGIKRTAAQAEDEEIEVETVEDEMAAYMAACGPSRSLMLDMCRVHGICFAASDTAARLHRRILYMEGPPSAADIGGGNGDEGDAEGMVEGDSAVGGEGAPPSPPTPEHAANPPPPTPMPAADDPAMTRASKYLAAQSTGKATAPKEKATKRRPPSHPLQQKAIKKKTTSRKRSSALATKQQVSARAAPLKSSSSGQSKRLAPVTLADGQTLNRKGTMRALRAWLTKLNAEHALKHNLLCLVWWQPIRRTFMYADLKTRRAKPCTSASAALQRMQEITGCDFYADMRQRSHEILADDPTE